MTDLTVISLGAGVQSSALYFMACRGMITPKPSAAIFADTQDEGDRTYRWLRRLEEHPEATIPILRKTAGSLSAEVFRSMDGDGIRIRSDPHLRRQRQWAGKPRQKAMHPEPQDGGCLSGGSRTPRPQVSRATRREDGRSLDRHFRG